MKGKRILVVEDDPGFQELITLILSAEFELTLCPSVEDSLPKLDSGSYDLVITDINLFGMTGFEVLARVRRAGLLESCPVVLCSSQFDEDTKRKALDMGAAGFIAKPYQREGLLAMVRGFLG
jgi:two-component system chemotaxis response regulator CheY